MAILYLEARKAAKNIARHIAYIDLLTDLDLNEKKYTKALYIPKGTGLKGIPHSLTAAGEKDTQKVGRRPPGP